jgi:exopolyphosphatase/guanosine-5'-triphosphate,3'-diphosphate pyrophosphatase
VRNSKLQGYWPEEIEVLANVIRHHRGKAPDPEKHEAFRALAPWHQGVVRKLAAILRAADALDRRRRQSVRDLRAELDGEGVIIHVHGAGDLEPELDALEKKGALLAQVLDRCLEIRVEP